MSKSPRLSELEQRLIKYFGAAALGWLYTGLHPTHTTKAACLHKAFQAAAIYGAHTTLDEMNIWAKQLELELQSRNSATYTHK